MALATALGNTAFLLIKKYRLTTIENLNNIFPDTIEKNIETSRKVFINIAKNGAEWIKTRQLPPEKIQRLVSEVSGLKYLDSALALKRGAIVLAGHIGNWELLPMYIWLKGYRGSAIARRLYFYKYDKLINGIRTRFSRYMLYRDESPKKFIQVLKRGEILGILADQDMDSTSGVFVDFLSKPAYTSIAPAKLAIATGAPIVPAFMIRKKNDTYKLIIEKPIFADVQDRSDEEVTRLTQEWSRVVEKCILEFPEQWVWMHKRWKTKVPEERVLNYN
ncbi:lipid A biosynthesis acyltransferase [Candidatus Omnitrophus magneticus]|uniref:Lipid A biosynthesis acyltransferase n=1 Tax=Candidatus Omnitrophus magneticus TaxID=1609969 RepID=A0A0F0CQV3_9BACT|nr:lipid A biosynthesis acyltransferase [Candidatus Omnitrophus magneticus]